MIQKYIITVEKNVVNSVTQVSFDDGLTPGMRIETELNPTQLFNSIIYDNGTIEYLGDRPPNHKIDVVNKKFIPDVDSGWASIRNQRDRLLQASDWTQLPDVPVATKEAWAVYRQALRDVTLQPDPFNITWPQPPQ